MDQPRSETVFNNLQTVLNEGKWNVEGIYKKRSFR